jgi:hypothetical protein
VGSLKNPGNYIENRERRASRKRDDKGKVN